MKLAGKANLSVQIGKSLTQALSCSMRSSWEDDSHLVFKYGDLNCFKSGKQQKSACRPLPPPCTHQIGLPDASFPEETADMPKAALPSQDRPQIPRCLQVRSGRGFFSPHEQQQRKQLQEYASASLPQDLQWDMGLQAVKKSLCRQTSLDQHWARKSPSSAMKWPGVAKQVSKKGKRAGAARRSKGASDNMRLVRWAFPSVPACAELSLPGQQAMHEEKGRTDLSSPGLAGAGGCLSCPCSTGQSLRPAYSQCVCAWNGNDQGHGAPAASNHESPQISDMRDSDTLLQSHSATSAQSDSQSSARQQGERGFVEACTTLDLPIRTQLWEDAHPDLAFLNQV